MRNIIISAFLFLLPLTSPAQKITLGSSNIVMDNIHGIYKGEMAAGKPNGKGNVTFDNGNVYEGNFVKVCWCGERECEDKVKEYAQATSRVMTDEPCEHEKCAICGKPAKKKVYFARAY